MQSIFGLNFMAKEWSSWNEETTIIHRRTIQEDHHLHKILTLAKNINVQINTMSKSLIIDHKHNVNKIIILMSIEITIKCSILEQTKTETNGFYDRACWEGVCYWVTKVEIANI